MENDDDMLDDFFFTEADLKVAAGKCENILVRITAAGAEGHGQENVRHQ